MNIKRISHFIVLVLLSLGLVLASAVPANAKPDSGVCGPLDSGKIDTDGEPLFMTVVAKEGFLVAGYCVKAGSANQGDGPEYFVLKPGEKSVTFKHSTGKSISHYSYTLVEIKAPDPVVPDPVVPDPVVPDPVVPDPVVPDPVVPDPVVPDPVVPDPVVPDPVVPDPVVPDPAPVTPTPVPDVPTTEPTVPAPGPIEKPGTDQEPVPAEQDKPDTVLTEELAYTGYSYQSALLLSLALLAVGIFLNLTNKTRSVLNKRTTIKI